MFINFLEVQSPIPLPELNSDHSRSCRNPSRGKISEFNTGKHCDCRVRWTRCCTNCATQLLIKFEITCYWEKSHFAKEIHIFLKVLLKIRRRVFIFVKSEGQILLQRHFYEHFSCIFFSMYIDLFSCNFCFLINGTKWT